MNTLNNDNITNTHGVKSCAACRYDNICVDESSMNAESVVCSGFRKKLSLVASEIAKACDTCNESKTCLNASLTVKGCEYWSGQIFSAEERERMYGDQLDLQIPSLVTCVKTYIDNCLANNLLNICVRYNPSQYALEVYIESYKIVDIVWNTDPDGYSYGANTDNKWYACAIHELKVGQFRSQIAALAGASTSKEMKDFKDDKEIYAYIITLVESVNLLNKALRGVTIWKE